MKLSDYRQDYYLFSGQVSSVTRQAAFAGIATVWIFSSASPPSVSLPAELMLPAICFIACLLSDFLHYSVSTLIWGWFQRSKEREFGTGNDPELNAPAFYNWPAITLFWAKQLFALLGFYFLLVYSIRAIQLI